MLSLVAAFTTWVALLSWKDFSVAWGQFMGPLVLIALVVALSGAMLRWLRVPGPLVVLAQVVVVGAWSAVCICGSPIPIGDALAADGAGLRGGRRHRTASTPLPYPAAFPRSTRC